jgi:O-antigen/teichoic acid export membrane protein
LKFWIGADFAERSVGVFRLLLLTYVTIGLTVVSYNIILAAGQPRVLGLANLGTFAANVVLILILIPRYGVIGAGWAYLLSVLPLLLLVLYAERSVLASGHRHWLRDLARFALPTAAAAATAILLEPVASNLAEVLLVAAAAAGVLVLLYLQWFAERNDHELVLQLVAIPRLRHFVRRP